MTWIKDASDTFVNLNSWDELDCFTISDKSTNEPVCYKVFLKKDGCKTRILGYARYENGDHEKILESIIKGMDLRLKNLSSFLYDYLDDEFDQKEKGSVLSFDERYEMRMTEIKKLIRTRFVEDE
jgi:hypothetical protein